MPVSISHIGQKLSTKQKQFLEIFARSCRRSIIEMTSRAKSGHPGGSLSSIDYLTLLYCQILSYTQEPLVISGGHIAPAVYAVLSELGVISKKDVLKNFRAAGSIFEGHVSRQVKGVWYGTGPLGIGASVASGFALAKKLSKQKNAPSTKTQKVFLTLGDGELQEGQVYEMLNFSAKYKLENLIAFVDSNKVQLSSAVQNIMPFHPQKIFTACGWKVIETDGHNFDDLWKALSEAYQTKNTPVVIFGNTCMGRGVSFMEKTGKKHQSTWHGTAPTPQETKMALQELFVSPEEKEFLEAEKNILDFKGTHPDFIRPVTKLKVKTGTPRVYESNEYTDCRTAYGNTLLDLAKHNKNILALTADLSVSVKTDIVQHKFPDQHIECGIAEQHMVSCAGGLSLSGFIPFVSTFGAFMTSRAKDQARVNDLNETNVKMVATHCGLSVGEDGPTHQAIDDIGSMLGLFNTFVFEPADPNHCDRIVRFVASHYGNFYVRMGRHKIPVLTKEDGTPFFDKKYKVEYGKTDILRTGKDLTVCASGSMAAEAFKAYESIKKSHPNISLELILISSPKLFDETLFNSIRKTKKVLTVEDHTTKSGFGNQLAQTLFKMNIPVELLRCLGVDDYQTSGTYEALYERSHISSSEIEKTILQLLCKPKRQNIFSLFM